MGGSFVALRVDTKPFDDVRVRRALNMAVNKQEIIKAYYGGNAEMLGFPMHSRLGWLLRAAVRHARIGAELYTFNPTKAKALLAEAGYPNGFSFKTQTSSASPTTTCWRWWPPTWPRWA
jgi:peptide/nickel transport system substrate-binding protein